MYYKRFNEKHLDEAIAKETVTTEQAALIQNFYKNDVFILRDQDSVRKIQEVFSDVAVEYDTEKGLHFVKILTWPHLKPMCLKFAPRNPCRWIYVRELDNSTLLEYDMDTYSVALV